MERLDGFSIMELVRREKYEGALGVMFGAGRDGIRAPLMRRSREFLAVPEVREALNRAAGILQKEGDRERGRRLFRIGLGFESVPFLTRAALGGDGLDCLWLGAALTNLGRCEEALPHLQKAVKLRGDEADRRWLATCLERLLAGGGTSSARTGVETRENAGVSASHGYFVTIAVGLVACIVVLTTGWMIVNSIPPGADSKSRARAASPPKRSDQSGERAAHSGTQSGGAGGELDVLRAGIKAEIADIEETEAGLMAKTVQLDALSTTMRRASSCGGPAR